MRQGQPANWTAAVRPNEGLWYLLLEDLHP